MGREHGAMGIRVLAFNPLFERAHVVLQAVKDRFGQVKQIALQIGDGRRRVVEQQQLNAIGEVNEPTQPLLGIRRSIGLLTSRAGSIAQSRRSQSKVAASRTEGHICPLENAALLIL